MADDDPSSLIRASGWRQGDLLGPEYLAGMINDSVDHKLALNSQGWLVILTQDCDLLRDVGREPFVEILLLSPTTQADRQLPQNRGQSSRTLVLEARSASGPKYFSASIHDRFRVKKADFVSVASSPNESSQGYTLPHDERRRLVRWLAQRYARSAFPDDFERCLASTKNPVKSLFKSEDAKAVSSIFLRLEDDNPGPNRPFVLHAILAGSDADVNDQVTRGKIDRFEQQFIKVLGKQSRITFALKYDDDPDSVDVRVMSEDDITVSMLRSFRLLDVDYRSVDEDDAACSAIGL